MTRERLFGWVGSVSLQIFALGALGVSPYLSYENLPEPQNPTPLRDYVPVIEIPRPPVGPQRAPATYGEAPQRASAPKAFVAPSEIPVEILPEPGFFEESSEVVPFGIPFGIPYSLDEAPAPEIVDSTAPSAPVRPGGNVRAPRKRHHVSPIYPSVALAARLQGTVVLEATIDENGNMVNLRVLESIPLLDGAAIEAVRQWKYEPTLLNGRPVPILMSVSVRFELGR